MCDVRFLIAYLIKYTSGTEEKNEAKLLYTGDKKSVEVVDMEQKHLKITSQKMLDDKRKKANPEPLIREVSQTEMDWNLLSHPYVFETCCYIHVNTREAADRCTLIKERSRQGRPLDRTHQPRGIECRSDLNRITQSKRMFTKSQHVLIRDFDTGKYSIDKIQSFNIRPPELMAVDMPGCYALYFHTKSFDQKNSEWRVHPDDITQSPLIDGAFRQVKFVHSTLDDLNEWLEQRQTEIENARARNQRPKIPASFLEPQVTEYN